MIDFKKALNQFTREMMGPSVAHMTDDELDAWIEPWRQMVGPMPEEDSPGFPVWFVKRRNEERSKLLAVLTLRYVALDVRHVPVDVPQLDA